MLPTKTKGLTLPHLDIGQFCPKKRTLNMLKTYEANISNDSPELLSSGFDSPSVKVKLNL